MGTLSLRLPNSLHGRLKELARKEGVSINQLIGTAVAEKVATLLAEEHQDERVRRASLQSYQDLLSGPAETRASEASLLPGASRLCSS